MRKFLLGAFVALFAFISVQAYDTVKPKLSVKLYPEGQNVDKGIEEDGKVITLGPCESNELTGDMTIDNDGRVGNIGDDAYIDIYLPEPFQSNGKMVLVCPGGGYAYCSGTKEGVLVADWGLKNGYAVCVIFYRMPNGHSLVPVTDVQNAFRYCRAHAEEWGIKQIGVMGFSAGGHLAASASTLFVDEITRPDFSVLVYPVITFEEFVTHSGTRRRLIGENAKKDAVEYFSLENRVTSETPNTLLLLSADDRTVPAENSLRYYSALLKKGVSSELHIFTSGKHGWGFATVENSGKDALGDQRQDFFDILSRWLQAR